LQAKLFKDIFRVAYLNKWPESIWANWSRVQNYDWKCNLRLSFKYVLRFIKITFIILFFWDLGRIQKIGLNTKIFFFDWQ